MTKTHFVTIFFVTSKHLRQKHFVTTRWLAATTLAQSQDQVWTVGVQGEDKSAFCNGLWNPSLYMLYSFSNRAHIQIQYLFYAQGALAPLRFPIWHDILSRNTYAGASDKFYVWALARKHTLLILISNPPYMHYPRALASSSASSSSGWKYFYF